MQNQKRDLNDEIDEDIPEGVVVNASANGKIACKSTGGLKGRMEEL